MSTAGDRESRLRLVVENHQKMPFAWAIHDCVLFAARCIDAQLGTQFEVDIQRDFSYDGPIAAIRIIAQAGGWEPLISRYLGPSVPAHALEFGDVLLGHAPEPYEHTTLVGVCDEELFMAPDFRGLTWLPMTNALMGWKLRDIANRQRGNVE